MNTKLLDGLDISLDVYEMSWDFSELQIAGEHIYIGHQLKRAVTSRWLVFCVGIGTSDHRASVLPVTLRSELAVGFSDTAGATSGTIG